MNLSEFKDYTKGKSIIVVGNNLTAVEREQGKLIDSYDIVVRFGKGLPDGREKYLGSRTDVWVTGSFRYDMRHHVPDDAIVLFNPSTHTKKAVKLHYEHLSIYTAEKVKDICKQYNDTSDHRLSAGAITAHWFVNEIKNYKEITFINFDFFQQTVLFRDHTQGIINSAQSWHLPLLSKEFINKDNLADNAAHNPKLERAVFSDIFKQPNTHFVGERLDGLQIIDAPNASYDSVRGKI